MECKENGTICKYADWVFEQYGSEFIFYFEIELTLYEVLTLNEID